MSRLPLSKTSTRAVPPVESEKNIVEPPSNPLAAPPLLMKVPLSAVELSKNHVSPPLKPLIVPPLLMKVALPAVAVPRKRLSGADGGEGSQTSRRRAVEEGYRDTAAVKKGRYKVLHDT